MTKEKFPAFVSRRGYSVIDDWNFNKKRILAWKEKHLKLFCDDVLTVMAGISWFNVDDEEERIWKFIEANFPHLISERAAVKEK